MRKPITIIAVSLLVWLVLAWFAGSWLHLEGGRLWLLRGGLALLGVLAAGLAFWFVRDRYKREQAAGEPPAAADELDLLIRDAGRTLAGAGGGKAKLSTLPAVFVIGESGAAKTSSIVHSGLDPELLAGQVYQESALLPTRVANLWYARQALFVEAGGAGVAQPGLWTRIARHLQANRLGSALGGGRPSARVALVFVEAPSLFRSGDEVAASARNLRARLGEISQTLGINLPVYVLFTKMDRVPGFMEFVRTLTNDEAAQVLGVTVPMATSRSGVYAEEEAARLTSVFEDLFRSLAGARPELLARENDTEARPSSYEFPREFRKLRQPLVQFLVDLCRPSQLTTGPVLRGFYFSGVRPVTVTETAPAPVAPARVERQQDFGATSIFRPDALPGGAAAQAAAAPRVVSRKVPQWTFLGRLFHDVILADRSAMGASEASVKTSGLRRALLASAVVLCVLGSIALLVSFRNNRALETRALDAARALQAMPAPGVNLASVEGLRRLEDLRGVLLDIRQLERDGPSLGYRWGLYTGDELYRPVRQLYFANFRRAMFGQTQTALVEELRALPPTPGPEYAPTYATLRAYLITTSHPDKSESPFLTPVLTEHWRKGQNVDTERLELARKQFDFYAEELRAGNPFSSANDGDAIAKARAYLKQFGGLERVYAAMLADANKASAPVSFTRTFPDAADVVQDSYEVPGAFSKGGWEFMRKSIGDPRKYFAGEEWVLGGDSAAPVVDVAGLSKQLGARYSADFVKHWRAYLKSASVVRYENIADAAKKLNKHASVQAPLMALFSLVSTHTAVDDPVVAEIFQPARALIPPGSERQFILPSNQTYMGALLKLEGVVANAASAPQLNDAVAAPVIAEAASARMVARQTGQAFRIDSEGHVEATVQRLIEEPITSVEALVRRLGPDELNAKGRELCAQQKRLLAKYPFHPNPAAPQATIDEVNAVFRKPDGALWKLYEGSLAKLLVKQGSQYVASGAPGATLNPSFVAAFNQQAAFSEFVYAGGVQQPRFTYSLKALPAEGIQAQTITIDGQQLTYSGGDAPAKQFVWQGGGAHGVAARYTIGGLELGWTEHEGLWSAFQFFALAESWQPAGSAYNLEWIVRTGAKPNMLPSGKPLTVRLQLDMAGGPPVFQKGYLSRIGCVADVAK